MGEQIALVGALRNAIASEQAVAVFYRKLSERSTHPEAQELFTALATQERDHAARLQAVYDRLELDDAPPEAAPEVVLAEAAPGQELPEDLDLPAAIEVALTAERSAHAYYTALAEQTTPPEATLFARLARQEQGHVERLEQLRALI